MPTTTKFALPYPAPSDPADVPADMGSLANRIDTIGGAVNGLATLDGTGKLTAAQVPAALTGELAFAQFTANVTITATTEAAANTIVTAPAAAVDGSTIVLVQFFAPLVLPDVVAGRSLAFWLYQDGVSIGQLAQVTNPASGQMIVPLFVVRRLTPASGSRVYSMRASVSGGSAAGTVFGGTGQTAPGFIRVTRA